MKNMIVAIIIFLVLLIILPFFGINSHYLLTNTVEWITKLVLPWIMLYWIIRLVKNLEIKQ
ncbi:hypothetical protein AMD00_05925 [Viridibacillus arvi]|uniref:Permease n=1 Tax=Viridibacillus arvi TaxID=263475 RepID=A0A0M0LLM8_9BACL|nr:hypothetical protein AMD00_05925 [Viridibacillus arvi]